MITDSTPKPPEVNTTSKVRVTNIKFANIKHGDNTYYITIMVSFTHDGANEEENKVSIEYFNVPCIVKK
jgi:hypothetical protein